MTGRLARILARKHQELETLDLGGLPDPPPRRPVELKRVSGEPLFLIAEIKLRSPSAGQLSTVLGVPERARRYAEAGASMLSVLCDREFFGGCFDHMLEARNATELPILCKEFVIDERQLRVARAYGADAVLLIVRCLPPARLVELIRAAKAESLVPFVEVASAEEAQLALDSGADLVGVNARDLDTLAMDLGRARAILESLPKSVSRVHLSGLSSAEMVESVARSGADAALIGEVLMRQDDPGPLLSRFVAAARNSRRLPESS